ncbi:non-ribosomal peptide synthetase [Bacillus cereus group sp. Bce030]|uniref:non-ribosomal peptide synthetase n=1 Tax=Bacillus cereus group sp. Bce030 TaxID=3445238 RepID=UPI00404335E9
MFFLEKLSYYSKNTPDKIAIFDGAEVYTYRDVEDITNYFANKLLKSIGENNRVLVKLPHGANVIFAIISIIKSGNSYVPVSNTISNEKIKDIIIGTKASAIISDNSELTLPSEISRFNTPDECLSEEIRNSDCFMSNNFKIIASEKEVYVLHTSGSTGKPKGVKVIRKNLNYILENLQNLFPVNKESVYLFSTPYTFDVSISEILGWIIGGGSVYCLDLSSLEVYRKFPSLINKYGVTHMAASPSAFNTILDSMDMNDLQLMNNSMKYVVIAGERFNPIIQHKWIQNNMNFKLFNAYGPTETTIYATCFELPKIAMDDIPIGQPLDGVKIEIQPIDDSNLGILLIGGDGVTAGYTDESLNKERFVVINGEKYYNTGDVVSCNKDQLYYHGRNDSQIQINGIRVELGEIEYLLEKIHGVQQAVVLFYQDKLLAFILSSNLTIHDMKKMATSVLERYMFPNDYHIIKTFPLTENNKVDRKSLLFSYEESKKSEKLIISKDMTEFEEVLRDKVALILNLPKELIGKDSDFFELGGDSLDVFQLLLKLEEMYETEFSLELIYTNRTLSRIASEVSKLLTTEREEVFEEKLHEEDFKLMEKEINGYLLNDEYQTTYSFETIHSQRVYYFDNFKSSVSFDYRVDTSYDKETVIKAIKTIINSNDLMRAMLRESDSRLEFKILNSIDSFPIFTLNRNVEKKSFIQKIESIGENLVYKARNNGGLLGFLALLIDKSGYTIVGVLDHTIADISCINIIKKMIGEELNGYSSKEKASYNDFCYEVREYNTIDSLKNNAYHNNLLAISKNVNDVNLNKLSKSLKCYEIDYPSQGDSFRIINFLSYVIGKRLLEIVDREQIVIKSVINGRENKLFDFSTTIGDFHGSLYLIYSKDENYEQFTNKSEGIFGKYYTTHPYRPGYAFGSNYPSKTKEQKKLKDQWNSISNTSINYIGEVSDYEKSSYYDTISNVFDNLEKIQDLIYVTAFSNNNKLTVFLNKNLGQLNFLEKMYYPTFI